MMIHKPLLYKMNCQLVTSRLSYGFILLEKGISVVVRATVYLSVDVQQGLSLEKLCPLQIKYEQNLRYFYLIKCEFLLN